MLCVGIMVIGGEFLLERAVLFDTPKKGKWRKLRPLLLLVHGFTMNPAVMQNPNTQPLTFSINSECQKIVAFSSYLETEQKTHQHVWTW